MAKVAIITNVLPNYRRDFYQQLHHRLGSDLTIYCQTNIPGLNLSTVHDEFDDCVRLVRSISVSRERISYQFLPLFELFSRFEIYFFYGNPRVISSVMAATLLRLLGKKVVIWGQLHTAGANQINERLRLNWWKLFKYIFIYTDSSADRLRAGAFKKHCVIGMNNGLNQRLIESEKLLWGASRINKWKTEHQLDGCTLLLSCARLDTKNRFYLMLDALTTIVEKNPNVLWCVIGDGPERDALKVHANALGLNDSVRWLGSIYEESRLAPWFMSALVMVHPGAIGLSLLHAYGYGLPVITHDNDEQHMPEIDALTTCNQELRFRENDVTDLARKIQKALANRNILGEISAAVLKVATFEYNTDVMVDRFCSVITAAGVELTPRTDGTEA